MSYFFFIKWKKQLNKHPQGKDRIFLYLHWTKKKGENIWSIINFLFWLLSMHAHAHNDLYNIVAVGLQANCQSATIQSTVRCQNMWHAPKYLLKFSELWIHIGHIDFDCIKCANKSVKKSFEIESKPNKKLRKMNEMPISK